jgi:hypothetical protein
VDEHCIGSQGPQRAVALEEKEKGKWKKMMMIKKEDVMMIKEKMK